MHQCNKPLNCSNLCPITVQISLFMCPTHSLTFFLNSASNNRNIIKIKIIPGNLQSIKQYSVTKYNGIRQCYDSSIHVHCWHNTHDHRQLCDIQSAPVYYKILINPMTAQQFENTDFWQESKCIQKGSVHIHTPNPLGIRPTEV